MSDVELFIVTWILSALTMASLIIQNYASAQLVVYKMKEHISGAALSKMRWSEKGASDIRFISTLILILSTVLGAIIGFTNYIPITERNPETDLFRILSIPPSFFVLFLVFGGVWIYAWRKALRGCTAAENLDKAGQVFI